MIIKHPKFKLYSMKNGAYCEPIWTVRLFNCPLRLFLHANGEIALIETVFDNVEKLEKVCNNLIFIHGKEKAYAL